MITVHELIEELEKIPNQQMIVFVDWSIPMGAKQWSKPIDEVKVYPHEVILK